MPTPVVPQLYRCLGLIQSLSGPGERTAIKAMVFGFDPFSEYFSEYYAVLKRNKYVGILSIAVTTLQYITISMITIFSMYIAHVRLGSGCNSYQGHVNDSGEFWRVLGCTRIRRH